MGSIYKEMNMKNKWMACLAFAAVIYTCSAGVVFAGTGGGSGISENGMNQALLERGYTKDTVQALSDSDRRELYNVVRKGGRVEISTIAKEIDNLSEMENILKKSRKELKKMGCTDAEITREKKAVRKICRSSRKTLKGKYKLDDTEIRFIKELDASVLGALKSADERDEKEIRQPVQASGSIASTQMKYTQAVADKSRKKPDYHVVLSYKLRYPFQLGLFSDKIAAAWGGGLNTSKEKGRASYSLTNGTRGGWKKSKIKYRKMSVNAVPNRGIKFAFPQAFGKGANVYKTKSGSASFNLYQHGKKRKDTKIVSYYCHRSVKMGNSGISITAGGAGVNLCPGKAWSKTKQRRTTISYS